MLVRTDTSRFSKKWFAKTSALKKQQKPTYTSTSTPTTPNKKKNKKTVSFALHNNTIKYFFDPSIKMDYMMHLYYMTKNDNMYGEMEPQFRKFVLRDMCILIQDIIQIKAYPIIIVSWLNNHLSSFVKNGHGSSLIIYYNILSNLDSLTDKYFNYYQYYLTHDDHKSYKIFQDLRENVGTDIYDAVTFTFTHRSISLTHVPKVSGMILEYILNHKSLSSSRYEEVYYNISDFISEAISLL